MSSLLRKVLEALHAEGAGIHPRLHALQLAESFLPRRGSGILRARLLSLAGFRMGEATLVNGLPKITGGSQLFARLVTGQGCLIEPDCVFDLSELVTLGDRVTLGPGVMLLTSTHELATADHRAGKVMSSPVSIGSGAWIGARAIVLPGVQIGEGAIVDPGAVVNKQVAPNTRVGGIPAIQREVLGTDGV